MELGGCLQMHRGVIVMLGTAFLYMVALDWKWLRSRVYMVLAIFMVRILCAPYLCICYVTCWLYKKYWIESMTSWAFNYATWEVLVGSDNIIQWNLVSAVCSATEFVPDVWPSVCAWCVTICLESVGATVLNLCYMVLMHSVNNVCLMNLILGIYCVVLFAWAYQPNLSAI